MNNNKGFTLVEMLVSFVIVSVIAGIMLNFLMTVKDRSEKSYALTQIAMTQANIAKTIKNDLGNYSLTNVATCGVGCYNFTYTTLGVKQLSINQTENTITYGTYVKKIPDGGLVGIAISIDNDHIDTIPTGNNSIFKLIIPINNIYNNNNNNVVITHQYNGDIGLTALSAAEQYGIGISNLYTTIYGTWLVNDGIATAIKKESTADDYFDGNYNFANAIWSFAPDKVVAGTPITNTQLNVLSNASTKRQYVYAGTNIYPLTALSNENRWQLLFVGGGGMTTGVSISGLKLIFENDTKYTLEEAVTNGYIQPLVIIASQAWSSSYIWRNVNNLKSGGATTSNNFPSLLVHFKTKTNKVKAIELNSNIAFNTQYDGILYYEWSSNFDMSLTLFPGTSL